MDWTPPVPVTYHSLYRVDYMSTKPSSYNLHMRILDAIAFTRYLKQEYAALIETSAVLRRDSRQLIEDSRVLRRPQSAPRTPNSERQ